MSPTGFGRVSVSKGDLLDYPPRFLSGMGAAAGLAFINSVGTMGGFVGPTMMGWLTGRTGSFDTGLAAMAGMLMISTGLAWSLRGFVRNE